MNKFIVFEGLEGSGKYTHATLLTEHLTKIGKDVIQVKEPIGCPTAENIMELLKTNSKKINLMQEFLLLTAARQAYISEVIKPALNSGKIVICECFYGSTLAYQCYAKDLNFKFAHNVSKEIALECRPGLTILINPPLELSRQRATKKDTILSYGKNNKPIEFYQKMYDGFLEMAKLENWIIVDSKDEIEKVQHTIMNIDFIKNNL